MRYFWLFCALGALLGCRQVTEPSGTAIALFCSTSEQSKTYILTQGDEIAVFARIEGTESCFLEAVKFTVKADGHSLMTAPAVAYPETNQAIHFFAYFPYHTGAFSVPTDQSQPEALKQADLCGAVARTTPVATPVALAFKHLLTRVVITTNEPTEKISFPNAVASGVVHAATAELVLGTAREDIWTESTTSKELIVPVQPLSRLVLTVANVEYVFDGSVSLEAGKTTTLNLTLHPSTKTATLSGSSITDWVASSTTGNLTQAVSNVFTVHWPKCHPPHGDIVNKVVFTIGGVDYPVSSGISYANLTFTVPFTSQTLRYPYTITNIEVYQSDKIDESSANLIGATICKSGAMAVGVNPSAIKIGDLWWATGNLVASNSTAGAHGEGGCRIGAPADGGLYFQFGSLIGYKGGDQANGGTGVGMPQAPLVFPAGGKFWGGATYSWAGEAMVWPSGMAGTKTSWTNTVGENIATLSDYYFNYSVAPWATYGQNIRDFSVLPGTGTGTLGSGRYAALGVGDPCTYYLGLSWRLPTTTEQASITGKSTDMWIYWPTDGLTGRWATTSEIFAGVSGPGTWFGADLNAGVGTPTVANLFFPASGCRNCLNGSLHSITTDSQCWGSSLHSLWDGCNLYGNYTGVIPRYLRDRSYGYPVRCVSN